MPSTWHARVSVRPPIAFPNQCLQANPTMIMAAPTNLRLINSCLVSYEGCSICMLFAWVHSVKHTSRHHHAAFSISQIWPIVFTSTYSAFLREPDNTDAFPSMIICTVVYSCTISIRYSYSHIIILGVVFSSSATASYIRSFLSTRIAQCALLYRFE